VGKLIDTEMLQHSQSACYWSEADAR